MLETYLERKAIDLAFNAASSILRNKGGGIDSDENNLEACLAHHLRFVKNWSEEVSFYDLKKAKNTEDVYVPLDLFVYPRRSRISEDEEIHALPLTKALNGRELHHIVILGQPGAGKTTTMKHVCREVLAGSHRLLEEINFPIVIRLREINKRRRTAQPDPDLFDDVIWSLFHEILGLQITYPTEICGKENIGQRSAIRKRMITELLEKLCPVIILDGFDEITHKTHREAILNELREIGTTLENACVILTSRTGDFKYSLDGFNHLELKPLNDSQIESFAYSWLGSKKDGNIFLKQLKKSPFKDTAIRPLTISHLCAIFERIGRIPEKPKTVYKKVVNLLIDEWDEQRSVKRGSAYASFDPDRKFELLSNLAYVLTISVRKTIFDTNDLTNCYGRIYQNYGLPKGEATKVVNELESHTGLFIESGYGLYEFSHKSLQEFLTAEYIVRLPTIPHKKSVVFSLPNELAIATSISSNSSAYFVALLLDRLVQFKKVPSQFIQAFVNRLLVEKPDFHKSIEVGWALIILYSLHFGAALESKPQMELFLTDTMGAEFDILVSLIHERTSVHDIKELYRTVQRDKAIDGVVVLTLEKKPSLPSDAYGNYYSQGFIRSLPNRLIVRENLLDENEANKKIQRARKLAADF